MDHITMHEPASETHENAWEIGCICEVYHPRAPVWEIDDTRRLTEFAVMGDHVLIVGKSDCDGFTRVLWRGKICDMRMRNLVFL